MEEIRSIPNVPNDRLHRLISDLNEELGKRPSIISQPDGRFRVNYYVEIDENPFDIIDIRVVRRY